MVCLGKPYHFILFKGCLPQILLGPFMNTLTHLLHYFIEIHFMPLVPSIPLENMEQKWAIPPFCNFLKNFVISTFYLWKELTEILKMVMFI